MILSLIIRSHLHLRSTMCRPSRQTDIKKLIAYVVGCPICGSLSIMGPVHVASLTCS